MLDNRFPNMVSLSSTDLPGLDAARAREARALADEIQRRTGRYVAFNRDTGGLYVYLKASEIDTGIIEFAYAKRDGRGFRLERKDLDDACRFINRGKMPRALKDRIERENKEAEKREAEQRRGRFCDGAARESERIILRSRDRRAMGKHFKGSALVDGLKGA